MMKRYLIVISFLILGSCYLLSFKINDESTKNIIGVYINDEYSNSVPLKDSGYYVDKIECDNNSSGEWDYVSWGLLTTNMSKKSKCNVYFRKDTIVNSIKSQLENTSKCPTVNDDGSVNVTSAESENSLLCSAPDNYGTSYYYRGNVSNNYVYFANFYWRIVRINGDGSIRIIYDGTSAHENGEASEDRQIGKSAFNEQADDNAYVGYMYGTPSSSTYEETHANINDSTIKKYVDKWYENNIKDARYEQYLSDNLFCNDKSVSNYRETYKNLGYGTENTYYRWAYGPWGNSKYENKYVKLVCNNIHDSFSLPNYDYGNEALTYPIALLSFDEATLAGGWNVANINYYLSNNAKQWWLMSAVDYYGGASATVGGVSSNGTLGTQDFVVGNRVNKIDGVKPVINLKQGSLKSGDGTITNAYLVD